MRIAEIRKREDMTQEALAKILEIPRNTLSQYETGARRIPVSMLPPIARALGCRIDDLFDEEVKER